MFDETPSILKHYGELHRLEFFCVDAPFDIMIRVHGMKEGEFCNKLRVKKIAHGFLKVWPIIDRSTGKCTNVATLSHFHAHEDQLFKLLLVEGKFCLSLCVDKSAPLSTVHLHH
jgi:hypothetical protein